ncbi:zinc finger AN1 domain-containing stress-associated protein 12 [Morus notabilis]|uniref:zinc finger AN1 domain-containing stress-associated protein 12 n=1 Tax=Morus notabilis TaxID=981085 RepID=UPI000CED1499|nr:zinc finger AN1 domain-containing stress-associated protein 12 [Morus notabilis]
MGGGTEAFPDLGKHCQHSDCHQLDFLPFNCDGCQKVFCLEHRSYKSHECPKSDHGSRKVVVCEICSASIETTGRDGEGEKMLLEKHAKSGSCDPNREKKPTCPVRRCKEALTFSNSSVCKTCHLKVCLKHRFPADHACNKVAAVSVAAAGGNGGRRWNDKFLAALASRSWKDCAKTKSGSGGSVSSNAKTNPSVKAF